MIDLIGQKFDRLVVIKRHSKDKNNHVLWLCLCRCGREVVVQSSNLIRCNTKSCGCLHKEIVIKVNTKHGHKRRGKITKTYKSWQDMIQRCTNPNNQAYSRYGDRGIIVCKRWRKFENFLEDMGEVPKGLQIDRKNNDKGYFLDNCYWATRKEQARNRRNNHLITYNGKKQCMTAWAEEYNIKDRTLFNRIYRYGWSTEKALTTPVGKQKK